MTVDVCQEEQKEAKLAELLNDVLREKNSRAVVFTYTKKKADEIAWKLLLRGWPAIGLHGEKRKKERDWVMSVFRTGEESVLVTTDAVAQDLVIENVRLVVNYDCPDCSVDYARRSRHVKRSGESGLVHTFINPAQQRQAKALIEILELSKQPVNPQLYSMCKGIRSKR
ncbi:hypothetical protein MTO96_008509 [Rhipicephalus appendiculatus]